MPDYIDRDKLLECIKKPPAWKTNVGGGGRAATEYQDGTFYPTGNASSTISAIIKAIENAPAADVEPARKWISVESSLPEIKEGYTSDTVLAYLNDGGYVFTQLEETSFGEFVFAVERQLSLRGDGETYVTHWLPMPQLPEPSKEDENE